MARSRNGQPGGCHVHVGRESGLAVKRDASRLSERHCASPFCKMQARLEALSDVA